MGGEVIGEEFYWRDPRIVALELLGNVLERALPGRVLRCVITETEAYLGPEDPGSRASMHRRGRIVERLRGPSGITLVYGVHGNWMLNIVAHSPGGIGAVLLRACEPISPGLGNTLGPGRLTRALRVDKSLDGVPVYICNSPLRVLRGPGPRAVARSHRIGLRRDLDEPLRFCDAGSRYLSRRC